MTNAASSVKSTIIKNQQFQQGLSQSIPVGEAGQRSGDVANVRAIKTGNTVSHIEVTCSCGNIARIECHYE